MISRASLKAKAKASTNGIVSVHRESLELPDNASFTTARSQASAHSPLMSHNRDLKTATHEFQKHYIVSAVTDAKGNWSEAARSLNTDRANLVRLAKRLGISIKKSIVNQ